MAKFDGIFDIEGTLKGMTFYKTSEGIRIRTKGGISKSRIQNDPAFERTRENGAEFSHTAKMTKLLRNSVSGLIDNAKDARTSNRLNRQMIRIKNLDALNERGKRTVFQGLIEPEAAQNLLGFDFNKNAPLATVLKKPYVLDTALGVFTLTDFITKKHLFLPQGVTHVALKMGASRVDFEAVSYEYTESNEVVLPISLTPVAEVALTLPTLPGGTGLLCFYLLIAFYQELNGVAYPLKNKQYNVLNLIAIE